MDPKYENHVQGQPLAPSSNFPRSYEQTFNNNHRQLSDEEGERITKKKKVQKYLACISLIAIFLAVIILVLSLVFLRAKSPKVRLDEVTIISNNGSSNAIFSARVLVKNKNFARYKFDSSVATIRSRENNSILGRFVIEDGRVRARRTKKIDVVANLGDLSSSRNLIVEARLRGKVELIRVFKRKKTAEMNCGISVNLATNNIQDLRCD